MLVLVLTESSDMANTSDFAQKLLDELRLRKERMAASKATNPMFAGQHQP